MLEGRLAGRRVARRAVLEFLSEFWRFLRLRKKYWLIPIFIIMACFGVLIVFGQGSVVAPLLYTLF
jgi:hypothetical protein